MRSIDVKINDLFINPDNPREEPQETEKEAIKILFKKEKQLIKLMKSIAIHGYEITERLIVVEADTPKKYTVMDGNRRTTCIKLLNDPTNTLPSNMPGRDRILNKINKIITENQYEPITKVEAVLFDIPAEEQEMKRIIRNKHTGENGGEGRLKWDYPAQIRFDKDEYKQHLVAVLDSILKVSRAFTTMERIVGDPDMRTKLGILVDKKQPSIKFINIESVKKLYYILELIKERKITVGDVYYKNDRNDFYEKYFQEKRDWNNVKIDSENKFKDFILENSSTNLEEKDPGTTNPEEKDPGTTNLEEKDSGTTNLEEKDSGTTNLEEKDSGTTNLEEKDSGTTNLEEKDSGTTNPEGKDPGTTNPEGKDPGTTNPEDEDSGKKRIELERQPDPNKELKQPRPEKNKFLFQGIIYEGNHQGVRYSLYELHRLNTSKYSLSATYLTRTLLECTLQEFLIKNNLFDKWNKPNRDPSITDLLNYCVTNKIFNKINTNFQRTINTAFSKKDHDELNSISHGKYNLPSIDVLKDIERRWYILIKYMISNLNK